MIFIEILRDVHISRHQYINTFRLPRYVPQNVGKAVQQKQMSFVVANLKSFGRYVFVYIYILYTNTVGRGCRPPQPPPLSEE